MSSRLKIQEFMILTTGGIPIFHYSPMSSRKLDELLSGFLSAISSFAIEFGEKSIQSLSFEGSELIYEQAGFDHIFVFLVDVNAPESLLRAALRDLSRKFLLEYEASLKKNIIVEETYKSFIVEVERALAFYERVLLSTSNLGPYSVPVIDKERFRKILKSGDVLDEFHRDFGSIGSRILDVIDGESTIDRISKMTGIEEKKVLEVIEYLAIWGLLKVSKLCPLLKKNDSRFDTFLDLIGLPQRDYQLLSRAKLYCNGTRSIEEVSKKIGVTSERLHEVLEKLGDQVDWVLVDVKSIATA